MKRILLFPLLLFAGMTLFACNPSDDAPSAPEMNTPEQSGNAGDSETNEHPENDENEDTPMENNTLKLTVNGRSFTATLVKNSSTEDNGSRCKCFMVANRRDNRIHTIILPIQTIH